MKNKYLRGAVGGAVAIILGAVIVSVGNSIGGTIGNVVTIIGGVGIIYAIVQMVRKTA